MIGYALVGSNDIEKAKTFFDALLSHAGASRVMEFPNGNCVWGSGQGKPMFGVCHPYDGNPAIVGNGTMISFLMDSRSQVDAIHAKALELGGKDEGAPGLRGEDGPQAFYGAYFRDLDGNKFCAFRVGPA